jgi:hypothetical protein
MFIGAGMERAWHTRRSRTPGTLAGGDKAGRVSHHAGVGKLSHRHASEAMRYATAAYTQQQRRRNMYSRDRSSRPQHAKKREQSHPASSLLAKSPYGAAVTRSGPPRPSGPGRPGGGRPGSRPASRPASRPSSRLSSTQQRRQQVTAGGGGLSVAAATAAGATPSPLRSSLHSPRFSPITGRTLLSGRPGLETHSAAVRSGRWQHSQSSMAGSRARAQAQREAQAMAQREAQAPAPLGFCDDEVAATVAATAAAATAAAATAAAAAAAVDTGGGSSRTDDGHGDGGGTSNDSGDDGDVVDSDGAPNSGLQLEQRHIDSMSPTCVTARDVPDSEPPRGNPTHASPMPHTPTDSDSDLEIAGEIEVCEEPEPEAMTTDSAVSYVDRARHQAADSFPDDMAAATRESHRLAEYHIARELSPCVPLEPCSLPARNAFVSFCVVSILYVCAWLIIACQLLRQQHADHCNQRSTFESCYWSGFFGSLVAAGRWKLAMAV